MSMEKWKWDQSSILDTNTFLPSPLTTATTSPSSTSILLSSSQQNQQQQQQIQQQHHHRQIQQQQNQQFSINLLSIDPTSTSYSLSTATNNIDYMSSSDDDDHDGTNKGEKSKRRPNIREHSKAQREKRKAIVADMENSAKSLTTQLNDMENLLRTNLEHIAFKRSYFHETISSFLSAWSSGDDRIETWQTLVDRQFTEMALPLTTTRYYPPGQIINGRRVLRGLNQVIADASSIALLCSSIVSKGSLPICSFTFSVEVPLHNFLVDNDVAFGSFKLFTKSVLLSGGLHEINISGNITFFF